MKKKYKLLGEIIVFVFVLIIITITYNYFVNQKVNDTLNKENTNETVSLIEIKNKEQFSKEINSNEGKVFVEFYARWCIPCRTISPIIKEIAKEHSDIKFMRVDLDKNEELAIEYNITNIPTIIIFRDGEIVNRFMGLVSKNDIVSSLEE